MGWCPNGQVGVTVQLWEGESTEQVAGGRHVCWACSGDSSWVPSGLMKAENESQLCQFVCISYQLLRNKGHQTWWLKTVFNHLTVLWVRTVCMVVLGLQADL